MYIDLSHISIDGLKVSEEISNLLDKYNIKTYGDLIKEIDSNNKEISGNYFLVKASYDVRNFMNNQSNGDKVFNQYLSIVSTQESLNLQIADIDKQVKVTDLPLFASQPSLIFRAIYRYGYCNKKDKEEKASELSKYSVSQLKERMTECCIVNGVAVPRILYYGTGIGEQRYNQIVATIMFYDKYVEQLLKTHPDCENPFYYMQEEKLQLVREKRKEVFNYLINEGYEFIFGDISEVIGVLDATYPKSPLTKKLFAVENVIANYVTMEEALDIENPKVLSKFIVPYGKK